MTGGQEAFLDEELLVGGMSGELQAASVPRAGEDRTEPTLTSGPRSAVVDFLDWIYNQPKYFPFTVDLMVWPVGLVVGALLKLVFDVGAAATELLGLITLAVVVHAVLGFATGLYRGRWRVASFTEASTVGVAWAGTSLVLAGTAFYTRLTLDSGLPTSAVISGCLASLVILMSERVVWRRYWETNLRPDPEHCQNTIVFGAGEGGSQIIRAMLLDPDSGYYPVALLDDDPKKRNREIEGVRVRGTRYDLPETAEATDAQILLVAVTHANSDMIADLAERAAAAGLELRVLPPASELVGRMTLADVRPPTVDDLLGRDPVEIDLEQVASYIRGRRVLVTGAGGSIGSELSKQIQGFGPAELFLLDRDENALHGVSARPAGARRGSFGRHRCPGRLGDHRQPGGSVDELGRQLHEVATSSNVAGAAQSCFDNKRQSLGLNYPHLNQWEDCLYWANLLRSPDAGGSMGEKDSPDSMELTFGAHWLDGFRCAGHRQMRMHGEPHPTLWATVRPT